MYILIDLSKILKKALIKRKKINNCIIMAWINSKLFNL